MAWLFLLAAGCMEVAGAGYAFAFADPDNKANASNAPGQIKALENRFENT